MIMTIKTAVVVWGFFWSNLAVDNWGTPYEDFSYFFDWSECHARAKDYAADNAMKRVPDCIRMTEVEAVQERRRIVEVQKRIQHGTGI